MRKVFVFILMVLVYGCVFAQQKPHYSQYNQSLAVLNPAVTGVYTGVDLRLGIRNQWLGLAQAPKTTFLTVSTPISLGGDLANYRASDLGVTVPENKDGMFDYTASNPHHALGVVFLNDKTGPLTRLTANITYAYHLAIGDRANFSVGAGFGVNRLGLNAQSLIFEEADDPVVGTSQQINKFTPDLNVGVYFYSANFYIGASMQQVLRNKLAFDGTYNSGNDVPHYFLTGGFQFWINEYLSVTPSVMLKMVNPLPKAFDLNLKFAYQNKLWLGGGYRKNDAYFANAGFNVANLFGLTYSYDFTTSQLKSLNSGSHELVISVLF